MIDSHCHIGFQGQDVAPILERARAAGVSQVLSVACSQTDYDDLIRLLKAEPSVYGAFGIHPESVKDMPTHDDFIHKSGAHKRLIAVGEIGLDYHYMTVDRATQYHAFETQLTWAYELRKPVIIHTRDAEKDTVAILSSAARAGLLQHSGILHCFTGTRHLAEVALDLGLYLSASGVITFKNADDIRSVFSQVPLDRLLVETDSPYMAPVPYRGHENEPAFVMETARRLAEMKSMTLAELDTLTTHNFNRLFHIKGNENAS